MSTGQGGDSGSFPCPHCPPSFTTKGACSLHACKAHPVEYFQSEKPVDRTRARWTSEELRRVAEAEVELAKARVPFMNQALQRLFPERTCGSIKSMRKTKKEYKEMVLSITAREASDRVPPLPVSPVAPVRDLSDLRAADEPHDDADTAAPREGVSPGKRRVRSQTWPSPPMIRPMNVNKQSYPI